MLRRCIEMSFFAELKRRNVLRAAAFYAASAWLLVQIATQVFPFFHIAEWVVRWIVVAAVIGFPFTLLFSWFYEWTPQGLKLESEIPPNESITRQTGRKLDRWIIAILSLAVVLLLANQFVLHRGESNSAQIATLSTPIPSKSIAVLPFTDLSPKHDQESFSDGMAEEILNALTRLKKLKVVGRASSFHYRGKDVSLQEIGADLGVAHVLEGSVRNQGDQLRITTTLLQTSDGVQEWSNTYDGKLADVFNLQESCARDIASQLDVFLGENGQQRLVDKTTDNAEAYALFIEARTLVNARVGDNLPRAIAKLDKVTALDPKFARAWSKLAVAHAVLPQYVGGDWAENLTMAEADATRAIALDPENAEAYAALGYIAFSRRRYVEMVAPAARALALDPDDDTANYWAANQLAAMGRSTEAENLLDHVLVRDPASGRVVFYKGAMRWRANDAATASKLSMRANALGFALGGGTLASIFAIKGNFDQGATEFARGYTAIGAKFSSPDLQTIYRGMYLGAAERAAALNVIATHKNEQYVPTFLLMLSEPERSFAEYERSATGLSDAYLNFLWQPDAWSRKARQSPAFQAFAQRIGLVDYWRKNRWPDLCSPVLGNGSDSFTCR
jgi:TolB-like protein/tetratricopeptide (TPR) repeat protein